MRLVKAALGVQRGVCDRLIEVEKAQRDGIRRAERVLLERTAEVVQPIIRVHGRDDQHLMLRRTMAPIRLAPPPWQ